MMLTDDEAQEMFDGLVELLRQEQFESRLRPIVEDVGRAIARGKPTTVEVSFDKRRRERVLRVVPLSATERLSLLVRAIELALVTPVDLAVATVSAMVTEDLPAMDLVFE